MNRLGVEQLLKVVTSLIDCQNGFEKDGVTISGLPVLNGNLQLDLTMESAPGATARLDVWAEYHVQSELDMVGGQIWNVFS